MADLSFVCVCACVCVHACIDICKQSFRSEIKQSILVWWTMRGLYLFNESVLSASGQGGHNNCRGQEEVRKTKYVITSLQKKILRG